MAKPIIGLDLDGVVIDHTENKLRAAREFGFRLAPKETASDVMKTKIPEAAYKKIQWRLYDDPELAFAPPLMQGVLVTLDYLRLAGYDYFLISRRKNPEVGIEILRRRGVWPYFFNRDNVHFVENAEAKNERAAELGITAFIDDEPSVIAKLIRVQEKFLLDPHGSYPTAAANFRIVSSWQEFLNHLPRES